MTESAKIAAANNYSRDVAAADAAYNQGMGELNHYLRTEQKSAQDATYNRVLGLINDGYYNTSDDIKKYLDGLGEGAVSEEQKNDLLYRYGVIAADPDQQAADNAYNNQKTLTVSQGKATDVGGYLSKTNAGNNFTIGGYKVELGDAAAEGAVPADKIANVADKVPFAYNGAIYIKINGTAYAVRGRGGKLDSDGYKDALDYLMNGTAASTSGTAGAGTQSATVGGQQQTGQTTPYIIAENADMIVYSDGTKVRKSRY